MSFVLQSIATVTVRVFEIKKRTVIKETPDPLTLQFYHPFFFLEEFSPSGNDPNKNFRCDIEDTEWEFTKTLHIYNHRGSLLQHSVFTEVVRFTFWSPDSLKWLHSRAPVVQTLDSAIHRLNHYPADKYWKS